MPDILYPYARAQLLTPEATLPPGRGGEPRIRPSLYVDHTHGSKGTPEQIGRFFDHDDIVTEAHLSWANDGHVVQFQYLDRQADAQGAANGRAISGETQDDGIVDKPMTRQQIEAKSLFLAWAHLHPEIRLRLGRCTNATGDGVGHHSAFPSWNRNGHRCPNPVRERQLYDLVLPGAIYLVHTHAEQEDDMQTTDVIDTLTTPDDKGVWLLQRDGGVLTTGKAPFLGSYPGLPPAKRRGTRLFVNIRPVAGGGYELIADDGARYRFPPK